MEGRGGAFVPPVARPTCLAVLASMVVALTVTPALACCCCRRAPVERRGSAVAALDPARATADAVTGVEPARPRRGLAARRRRGRARRVCDRTPAAVGSSALPAFRDAEPPRPLDARARHVAARRWTGSPSSVSAGAALGPRRRRRRRRTSGGRCRQTRSSDVNSGELWVSIDPDADYDSDRGRDPMRSSTGTRRSSTSFRTYCGRADRALRCHQPDARPRRPRLRPGPRACSGRRRTRSGGGWSGSTASPIRAWSAAAAGADRPGRGRPGGRGALRHQAGRRAPRRGHPPVRASSSAACSSSRRSSRSSCGARPRRASSLDSVQDLLIDTRSGGHVRARRVADVRVAATPTVIRREDVSRYARRRRRRDGRDLGAVGR